MKIGIDYRCEPNRQYKPFFQHENNSGSDKLIQYIASKNLNNITGAQPQNKLCSDKPEHSIIAILNGLC